MRNVHNLSHYKLATFDMGELVPVGLVEVMPGDSFRHQVSMLLRVSPLLAPVMHPISVRVHHFFVPFRLIWSQWEDFITGGSDGLGDGAVFPTRDVSAQGVGGLWDYLGVPTNSPAGTVASVLPIRAYVAIFNDYYRDQDLVAEVALSTTGGVDATTSAALQKISWEKDYFTAARPWPQRGAAVTMPLGTTAPVKGNTGAQGVWKARAVTTGNLVGASAMDTNASGEVGVPASRVYLDPGQGTTNLYADLSTATAATVAQLRRAVALQSYQEARAMYGAEYVDYLRMAFGVRSSDARLQRPEYLGGGKQTISFSEVLQTGPDADTTGVADLRGHGIAALRSSGYTRFFEEHGYVMSLASVRPRSMYGDGLHRMFSKTTKEDFYQKELEFIGQQEVYNREVRAAHATPAGVFGYQDRYSEYRHQPSMVAGEFRSTLNFWHLGRQFASDPALNSTFVTCTPGKRINADQTNDQLWVMVNHNLRARRMLRPPQAGRVL